MGRRQRSCRMRASRASARPQASPRARSRDGRSCHSAYVRLKGSGEGQKSAGEPAGEVPRVSKTQTAAAQRGRVASQRHTAPCTHRPPHGPAASIACGRSSASLPARRRIAGRLPRDRHRDTYTQDAAHLPENEPRKRSTPPCSRCACAAANARRSSTATATSIAARGHPPPRGARIALDAKHTRHNKRRLRCDQLSRPLVQHSRLRLPLGQAPRAVGLRHDPLSACCGDERSVFVAPHTTRRICASTPLSSAASLFI